MIKIVANGIEMDLPADLRIPLTIENPLFSTDRIPVAYTTNIDFPLTQNNLQVFGFQDKLFLRPSTDKIPAMLYINELRVMAGTLCFDSCEDKAIRASFVGADIEDFLDKDLSEINMQEWTFGTLTLAEKQRYAALLESAAQGHEVFVCGPIATTRPTTKQFSSAKSLINNINMYGDFFAGLANTYWFLDYYYPAVRLPYIIRQILSDNVTIRDIDIDALNDIVLLTSSKINEDTNTYEETGGLVKVSENPEQYVFSLSAAMPKIKNGELIKEIMKMLGLTIYTHNNKYVLVSNASIIRDNEFDNWTNKISDNYSIYIEEKKAYKYGYANEKKEELPDDTIIEVDSIMTMLQTGTEFLETSYFAIKGSDNVYLRSGYIFESGGRKYVDYDFSVIGKLNRNATNSTEEGDYFDSSVKINIPKNIITTNVRKKYPDHVDASDFIENIEVLKIDAPDSGERPTTINLGIFIGRVPLVYEILTGSEANGLFRDGPWKALDSYPAIVGTPYDMFGNKHSNISLEWEGENGLFNLYHKEFAEWIRNNRLRFKTEVNLSALDLKNLQLYKKKLIKGKKFLISQISVEINHDGLLPAEIEFIEVPDPA